jgi:hypothetical protein
MRIETTPPTVVWLDPPIGKVTRGIRGLELDGEVKRVAERDEDTATCTSYLNKLEEMLKESIFMSRIFAYAG